MAVLRQHGARHVVHRPAGVGARNRDLDEGHAVRLQRGGLDHARNPAVDLRDHGAAQERHGLQGHAAAVGRRHLEGLLGAADAGAAERRPGVDEGGLAHRARGEAGPLLDRSPGFVLGDKILARAASRQQQHRAEKAKNYAGLQGRHGTGTLLAVTLTTD